MIELKNDFRGGLNYDDSYYKLPPNSYVGANNVTRDAIANNQDSIISNITGNRVIVYSFPAGRNKSIGAVANPLRNTFISLVYNSNSFHSVVEYNLTTRSATKVFENLTDSAGVDILGLTENDKITGINIFNRDEGDFLFFLDSLGRPTFMNLTLFKAGAYTPVTRQIIDVAKIPPPSPPPCVYGNDTTRPSNYCQKKLFRFKYRRVYDDNFKSTYSPVSALALPVNILNQVAANVVTNNNFISISLESGPKNVKGIELAVSVQNNSNVFGRFRTVDFINKEEESIDDDVTFDYAFYNDSTYPFVPDDESNPVQDFVPRYAKSQETPNGTYLCYGAITEGYDRTLDPNVVITVTTVAAGSGSAIGSLNGVVSGNSIIKIITFSGIPAVGTVVNVFILVGGSVNTLAGTYTTVSGDTPSSVAIGLDASMTSLGVALTPIASGDRIIFVINVLNLDTFGSLVVTPPSSIAGANSISTWPFWGQRRMGIVYFDEQGRTNGVLYDADITLPGYAENGSQQVLLPYLNIKIYHVPPIWSYSYQIVFTKDLTQFLYLETVDVNTDDPNFLYFEITNLGLNQRKNPTTAQVVSWTFQDGDRVRLIRGMLSNTVYGTAYDSAVEGIVVSPTINNVTQTDKTFIKVARVAPFTTVNYTPNFFIVQLYRPTLQEPSDENATFYECGVQFPILNPGTEIRVHGGQVSNQSTDYVTPAEVDIYNGDVYFRIRNEYLTETGIATFNVQDRNFVDFFISAVNNIDGRPSLIDINAKETYFPSLLRYSEQYQPNTNINGFNKFYFDRFLECDYSFGDILRLKVRDRFMRVFQTLKVGVIYLFSKIGKSPGGDEVTINTDQLLNPVNYYSGDYGIGTHKESLSSFNFADYFTSDITGGVYRVSLNGTEPISVLYKMNSWALDNLPLRTGNYKVYGSFDQRLNNYIIALEATGSPSSMIVYRQSKSGLFTYNFELANNPNPGDILNVRLQDGDGIIRNYQYVAINGDTVLSVAIAIAAVINADVYFTATLPFPSFPRVQTRQVTANNPVLFNGEATIEHIVTGSEAQTLVFNETDNTFDSFCSFHPEFMVSVGTTLITFKEGQAYTHDSTAYNTFYGVEYDSDITPVFNSVSAAKQQPMSITYASENTVWDCPEIITNVKSYGTTNQQTNLKSVEFTLLEGMRVGSIKRDQNSRGGKVNGQFMKMNWMSVKFRNQNATNLVTLETIILKTIESPLNVK